MAKRQSMGVKFNHRERAAANELADEWGLSVGEMLRRLVHQAAQQRAQERAQASERQTQPAGAA